MCLSSFAVSSLPFLLMLLLLCFVGKAFAFCCALTTRASGLNLRTNQELSGLSWVTHMVCLYLPFFFSTETTNPSKLDEGQVLENLSVGLLDHTVLLRDINVTAIRSFPP